jgi:hypothetical protein
VSSYGYWSFIYYYKVCCRLLTSVYSFSIVSTSLVWFAVYGGVSILSRQLALYLALSILLFCANNLRIFDIWGSFLALAAEPRIKTNFYSSSVASYYNLASLVWISTLVECVLFCLALSNVMNRSSYS